MHLESQTGGLVLSESGESRVTEDGLGTLMRPEAVFTQHLLPIIHSGPLRPPSGIRRLIQP